MRGRGGFLLALQSGTVRRSERNKSYSADANASMTRTSGAFYLAQPISCLYTGSLPHSSLNADQVCLVHIQLTHWALVSKRDVLTHELDCSGEGTFCQPSD